MRSQPGDQGHSYAIRNRLLNPVIRFLLTSPLHPLLSGSVALLTYNGVRSGRPHTLPVQYARHGGQIIVLAADGGNKRWWRNLRRPAPVRLRIAGTTVEATGSVVVDPERGAELLRRYLELSTASSAASTATVVCLDIGPAG